MVFCRAIRMCLDGKKDPTIFDICDVCQEIQTIKHLLYHCSYVKPLWNIVDLVYGTKVNFIQILGVDELF